MFPVKPRSIIQKKADKTKKTKKYINGYNKVNEKANIRLLF